MTKSICNEYEKDFYAWAVHNGKLLRDGKLSEADIENIAEEIESIGRREKRELIDRLTVLITQLLLWIYQSAKRNKSWESFIKLKRIEVNDILKESPSLEKELEREYKYYYERSVLITASQIGIEENVFPKSPPFNLQDCLNDFYFPMKLD